MPKIGVVYLITNLVTGRYYIGQTVSFAQRMRNHRSNRDMGKSVIGAAIKKHGWKNFAVEILGDAEAGDALNTLEKLWITIANSTERTVGYNLRLGDDRKVISEETRRKMSAAKKGRKQSPELIEKRRLACVGIKRPRTKEHQAKITESRNKNGPIRYWLGKKRPDTAERNKLVFAGKEPWNKGVKRATAAS